MPNNNIPAIFEDSGQFLKNPVFTADGEIYSLDPNSSRKPPEGTTVFTWRVLDEILADIEKNSQNWEINDEAEFKKILLEILQEILKTHLVTSLSLTFRDFITRSYPSLITLLMHGRFIFLFTLLLGLCVFAGGWLAPLLAWNSQDNSLALTLLISWLAIGPANAAGSAFLFLTLTFCVLPIVELDYNPAKSVHKKELSVTDEEINSAFHKLKNQGIFQGTPPYEPVLKDIIIDETKKLLMGKK